MTTDVAILTPDPAVGEYAKLWPRILERLQGALEAEGLRAVPAPWTRHADGGGLEAFACVLPLLAWSYHRDHGRWLRACAAWERAGLPMANPARVLAWNSDKRYLAELAERGVAIPPTRWTARLRASDLEAAFAETGADALIVKPTVSGGAWRTLKVARDGIAAALDQAAADAGAADGIELMIQPCVPTIASEGETSLLYFGGALSHVVNKRPVPGDFRVQETFGGAYRRLDAAPGGALELAGRVLDAIDAPLLYARIDMVPDAAGRWLLMEAELIEPDFYLGAAPEGGARFARALRRHLEASGS